MCFLCFLLGEISVPHIFSTSVMWMWDGKGNHPTVSCRQSCPPPGWFSPVMRSPGSPRKTTFQMSASYKQVSESHFPVAGQVSPIRTILEDGGQFLGALGLFLLPVKLLKVFSHSNSINPALWLWKLLFTEGRGGLSKLPKAMESMSETWEWGQDSPLLHKAASWSVSPKTLT